MNRVGFIGGSDMRRIMEGDWQSLWLEKTGKTKPEDLSDVLPVQLGIFTEQFNINWFEDQTGCSVKKQQHCAEMNWEGVPLKGTVDGYIWDNSGSENFFTEEIVECKHTYEGNSMENCLKTYMPQIQFYMWVHQSKGCYLSVIFGNRKWDTVYIQKDWQYIDQMKLYISQFWKHVSDNVEPMPNSNHPVSIDKIKVDGMVKRDASTDNHFIDRCHDYISYQQDAKLFESAKADLKAMVGDDEREVYCDLLSIKRDKRGSLRIAVKESQND